LADIGLIRKRLRAEIDAARKAAATRRERAAASARAYETFLEKIGVPVFRQIAMSLRAEGVPCEAQTPAGGVRLVSDRNRNDVVEIELDDTLDPPQPVLISTRTRGSRFLKTERPVKQGADIADITDDDVIESMIEQIRPWLG